MTGELDLGKLLKAMRPILNNGNYVFCTVERLTSEHIIHAVSIFKEQEGYSIIISQDLADKLELEYTFVASWITLAVHSSLQAVGFTTTFSKALSDRGISCNVVAACYHDHIFVLKDDAEKAMDILNEFSAA